MFDDGERYRAPQTPAARARGFARAEVAMGAGEADEDGLSGNREAHIRNNKRAFAALATFLYWAIQIGATHMGVVQTPAGTRSGTDTPRWGQARSPCRQTSLYSAYSGSGRLVSWFALRRGSEVPVVGFGTLVRPQNRGLPVGVAGSFVDAPLCGTPGGVRDLA